MKLSEAEIKSVAALARLELTQAETAAYSQELTNILDYVDKIGQAKAENQVEANMSGLQNVLREDKIIPSIDRDMALQNAPMQERGFIKVQTVFSEN